MCRSDVRLIVDITLLCLEKSSLIVVMVTDDVECRAVDLGRSIHIIVPCRHHVIHKVSKVDAIYRTLTRSTEGLDIRSNSIMPCLHGIIHTKGSHLRVSNHQNSITLMLSLTVKYKICLNSLYMTRNALVCLRQTISGRNHSICRHAEIHESCCFKIRSHCELTVCIGSHALTSVCNHKSDPRLSCRCLD